MPRRRVAVLALALAIGFGLSSKLGDHANNIDAAAGAVIEPSFQVRRFRTTLLLRGHTVSAAHEAELRTVAARLFPDHTIETQFLPLGIVPDHWQGSTHQTMYALQAIDSASANLSADALVIRGVTRNASNWQARLAATRAALPAGIRLQDDTIAVAPYDSSTLCARAMTGFDHQPVKFEESTAVLRQSAYPILQRVAALANACEQSVLGIVGHTDASGAEPANLVLSRRRAEAVGGFLEQQGVNADRMRISGVGSSDPVASNDTRYGRGLNRRIEIKFRPKNPR